MIDNVKIKDDGNYYCNITNEWKNRKTSSVVQLTVNGKMAKIAQNFRIEGNFGVWKNRQIWQISNHKFAKVSLAKILFSILNNYINVQVYFAKCIFVVNLPKFVPTKISLYAVHSYMNYYLYCLMITT